jgi:5'-deoxynucleotidase YfbR-like HD superfamily hydrolase
MDLRAVLVDALDQLDDVVRRTMDRADLAAAQRVRDALARHDRLNSDRSKKESWFTLASGRRFRPFDPRPEDIEVEDIALALSNICRFSGHCHRFYSVAEHSVHCSEVVPPEFAFAALMHDTTEAYVGDMIRPIKKFDPIFSEIEELVWGAICEKYRLPLELPSIVKWADDAVLKAEARDLLVPFGEPKFDQIKVDPPDGLHIWRPDLNIAPWSPDIACERFLARFHELYPLHEASTAR